MLPRHHGSPDLTYGDFIIVQSVWGMTQGVTMPLSGFLIRWTGARPAMFIGCAIFSLGTGLTYFTLEMVKELPQSFENFEFLGTPMGGFHVWVHLSLGPGHCSDSDNDHWHEMVSQPQGEDV